MSYYIQYTDAAEAGLAKVDDARRREIKSTADRTIGRDPYGHGSTPVRGNRDRREATVAGAIFLYEVSAGVLVVSVLRAVAI
ncbi:hypothetical protein [Embleya sp. NPDC050493]|uniref:hypothetical protein n=1 Tax=Embleya sp. NPDC050493 TaxID=3363989 RepID=UPI0037AF9DD3